MFFLVTTHSLPLFYADNADHPVKVSGIDFVYEKTEVDAKGLITSKSGSEPLIDDPMQAISVLYQYGIPSYKSKASAKTRAAELGLKTWKYLKVD